MTLDELLAEVDKFEPTEAAIKAMEQRLNDADSVFEQEQRDKQMTEELLNKEFTI